MMAFQSTPPPKGATTYTTDARDERLETDPSRALTMREVASLRWFFCEAESDMGVRSTFGAQLDAAIAQRISDESRIEAQQVRSIVTQLRKGKRPKGKALELAKDVGLLRSASMTVRIEQLGGEYIYMHAPAHNVVIDPYENDGVLRSVRRANEIRARLVRVGENHTKVLNAVYGPATHGEAREALRKRFGDLVEVVVAIVASRREESDPPARAMVRAKLSDDSFVRMLKHGASGYLREAANAYAGTRS